MAAVGERQRHAHCQTVSSSQQNGMQMLSDEELARQLQAQLHAEDAAERARMHDQRSSIAESLFMQQPRSDAGRGRRGRGKGRGGRHG